MTQTKFLITGATGYTGGYTVRQLLEKNQAVRVLAIGPTSDQSSCSRLALRSCSGTSSILTLCVPR